MTLLGVALSRLVGFWFDWLVRDDVCRSRSLFLVCLIGGVFELQMMFV